MNHRLLPRLRRRLKVSLGALKTFTADISAHGFAAELMSAPRPGADLCGSIELSGQHYPFTAKVCWTKIGEPRMHLRGRIGVRFTGIPNAFYEAFEMAYPGIALTSPA
jgi:hypothetical protein